MGKLIYVEASPRKKRSHGIDVAGSFLEAYRRARPDDEVETLDLWDVDLVPFDGDTIDAKYRIMSGQEHTPEEAAAWRAVVQTFEHFASGDRYLFSVPMWNFGIPYRLKHFIDVITQPGLAFSAGKGGYQGLVSGRPAVVVYARGGAYPDESPMDLQRGYLDLWLRFIGFEDIREVRVEPTQGRPEKVEAALERAREQARELASAL